MLIGLDFETTGLDTATISILEIAVVLYEDDLEEVAHYSTTIYADEDQLSSMNDYVTNMHTKSGLLQEISEGSSLDEVRESLHGLFDEWQHLFKLKRCPLMGNSVHFDRTLLRRFFPEIEAQVSHRNVDVSSFNEMARRWDKSTISESRMTHRALDDVRESCRMLKSYEYLWKRKTLLGRVVDWITKTFWC